MHKYFLIAIFSFVWCEAQAQSLPSDLQVAYSLCTKRYINRDKSIKAKWQPGYEDCDGVVARYESQQRAVDDVSQHRSKIKAIAGGK